MIFLRDSEYQTPEPTTDSLPAPSARSSIPSGGANVPSELLGVINDAASHYELPPSLLTGLLYQESRFNPRAVSPAGAKGIAQFMDGTAKEMGVADPFDPGQAIFGAAEYLRRQIDRFDGDVLKGLAAYNAGPGRVAAAVKNGDDWNKVLPPETRDYIMKVQMHADRYRNVFAEAMQAEPVAEEPIAAPVAEEEKPGLLGGLNNLRKSMQQETTDNLDQVGLEQNFGEGGANAAAFATTERDAARKKINASLAAAGPVDEREILRQEIGSGRSFGEMVADTATATAAGVKQLAAAPVGLVAPGSDLAASMKKSAGQTNATLSPQMQAQLEQFSLGIKNAADEGRWEEVKAAFGGMSPALVAHFTANTLPSMLPVLGAGKVAQIAAAARGASTTGVALAGVRGAGAANAVLNAGSARQDSYDDLKATFTEQGMTPDKAHHAALIQSVLPAAVGGATGYIGGRFGAESDILGGTLDMAAKGGVLPALKAAIGSLGRELTTEQAEELLPKMTTNLLAGRDAFDGAAEIAAQTVAGVAGPGSLGAMSAGRRAYDPIGLRQLDRDINAATFNPDSINATAVESLRTSNQIAPELTRKPTATQVAASGGSMADVANAEITPVVVPPPVAPVAPAPTQQAAAGTLVEAGQVDQNDIFNQIIGATNAAEPVQVVETPSQANGSQAGTEQATAPSGEVTPAAPEPVTASAIAGQAVQSKTEIPPEVAKQMQQRTPAELLLISQRTNDVILRGAAAAELKRREIDYAYAQKASGEQLSPDQLVEMEIQRAEQDNATLAAVDKASGVGELTETAFGLALKKAQQRAATKTDAELTVMAKANPDPVVQEAVKQELATRQQIPQQQQQQQAKARNIIDTAKDSALVAIAKLGGMDTQQLLANGFDQNDISVQKGARVSKKTGQLGKAPVRAKSVGFNLPIHRKGGMSLDGMREALAQRGYLPEDASVNDAIDLLNRELRGEPVYTQDAIESQAAEAEAERMALLEASDVADDQMDFEAESNAELRAINAAYDALSEDNQAFIRGMRKYGASDEEINGYIAEFERVREGAVDGAEASQAGSGESRGQESDFDGEALGGKESAEPDWLSDDSFALAGQTEAEVRAQEAERKAEEERTKREAAEAELARKDAELQAEIKRRSETAADTFELGQDGMDNLTGQGGLRFSKAPTNFEQSPEAEREFRETERAYGGREAYDRAVENGKTKLNYRQWVQVRTPRFKAWFGPFLENKALDRLLSSNQPSGGPIAKVLNRVTFAILDSQILDSIVAAIPVNVMDNLGGKQGATNMLLHDPAMFVDITSVARSEPDVVDFASRFGMAAESVVAVARAKLSSQSKAASANAEMLTAVDALQNNLIYVWRRLASQSGTRGFNGASVQPLLHSLSLAGIGAKPTPAIDGYLGSVKLRSAALTSEQKTLLLSGFFARERAELPPSGNKGGLGVVIDAAMLASGFHDKDYAPVLGDVQVVARASKVTDPQTGEPMVVYHGTAADFSAFDYAKTGANDRGLWGRGHYLTSVVRGANSYAERQGDGAQVIPAFVSLKNPLILTTGQDLITRLPDGTNYRELVGQNLDGAKIKGIAQSSGHDGVIQIKPDGFIGDLVSYSPTQIKSAIGNNGDFDATNPDIRKSFAGQSSATADTHALTNQQATTRIESILGKKVAKVLLDSGMISLANTNAEFERLIAASRGAKYMTAWHGSPHDFDQFSLSKIGTGEGAQAYGYGLYFASSKDVAEWYKNQLTTAGGREFVHGHIMKLVDYSGGANRLKSPSAIKEFFKTEADDKTSYIDGISDRDVTGIGTALYALSNNDGFANELSSVNGDLASVIERRDAAKSSVDGGDKSLFNEYLLLRKEAGEISKKAHEILSDAIYKAIPKGRLYQVDLAPSEDEYLDWDKPLSEQSEKVKDPLEKVGFRSESSKGQFIYTRLSDIEGSDKAASNYLHSIGIRGIRYLDGTSRGAGEGNHNYVIFNDADVSITEKYSKQGQALGATLPDGRIILNLDALTADNFAGVFKHEGFHSTVKNLLGEAKYNQLMQQMESQLKLAKGNAWVDQARAAVPADTKAEHKTEEVAAYAIEQVENGAKVPGFIQRWVGEFLSAIRTAIIRFAKADSKLQGWAMQNLKPEDLARLAVAGLRAKARGAMQGQMREGLAYSKTPMPDTIDVDGVERPTRNSNGQPIHPTEEGLRNFWRWFAGSKVVDAEGRPLVVYHGTTSKFYEFEDRNDRQGFYFAFDKKYADLFAEGGDGVVIDAFIKAEKVADFREGVSSRLYSELKDAGYNGSLLSYRPSEVWELFDGTSDLANALKNAGYDGVYLREPNLDGVGEFDSLLVFSTTKIKSATGNNGNFDGTSPDIRYSRASWSQQTGFDLPKFTTMDKWQERIQDRYNRFRDVLKYVRDQGGVVNDLNDFSMGEDRFHGVAMERVIGVQEKLQAILSEAKANDVTMDEVMMFGYAEHAPDRNRAMQAMNPNVQTGSGMSDQDAADIIAAADAEGNRATLEALTEKVRDIARDTLELQVRSGLTTRAEADAYRTKYGDKWVPLRGFETIDENGRTFRGTGRGFNIQGKENLQALGRDSKAGQILENVLLDAERTAIRATKNEEVNIRFLKFVIDNPDQNLWEVDKVKTIRIMRDGMVKEDMIIDKGDGTIGVKVNGEVVYIKVHDDKLFEQLANQWNDVEWNGIPYLQDFSRYLSKSYTAWSPEFALYTNPARDVQAALFSITGREGIGMTGGFVKAYPKALKMAYDSEVRGKDDPLYAEHKKMGGKTGFWNHNTLETKVKEIEALVKDMEATPTGNPFRYSWKMMKALEAVISNHAGALENATRFASYIAMREAGRSREESAAFAKNLNVNFNRRGTWTAGIGSIVLFFNPAIQGVHNQYETLLKGKHKYQAWALMAAHAAAMGGLAMLAASSGEDDDGVKWWDKIPDYEKERNIIIMLPSYMKDYGHGIEDSTGRYLKIPMPYQWNVGGYLGTLAADVYRNKENPTEGTSAPKAALLLGKSVVTSYVPGGIPPTIAPIVHHAFNDAPFGDGQLYPENSWNKHKPDSEKYTARQKDTPWQHWASFVNEATGGNEFESGYVSIAPAAWKNYVRSYVGGPASFVEGIYDAAIEEDITKAPFLRKMYGEVDMRRDAGKFYDTTEKPISKLKAYKDADKAGSEYANEIAKTHGVLLDLGEMALDYQKYIGKITKDDIAIKDDKSLNGEMKKMKLRKNEKERSDIQEQYLKEQRRIISEAALKK